MTVDAIGGFARARPLEHRSRRRWWVLAGALTLVAAVAGIGLYRLHASDRDVRADLAQTRVEFDAARSGAADARAARAGADEALATTVDRLGQANDRSDAVETLLGAMLRDLAAQQAELDETSSDVEAGSEQLDYLNLCLAGVTNAMRQASYDADSQVAATLEAVADACERARP